MIQFLNELQKHNNAMNINVSDLLSLITVFIPSLAACIKSLYSRSKEKREKKIFELFCKRESDNFYIFILFAELGIILLSEIGFLIINEMIVALASLLGKQFNIKSEIEIIIIGIISVIITIKMIKMKLIRKRLLGDKGGKIIIWCSIFLINIGVVCTNLKGNIQYLADICIMCYFLVEIAGVLHFEGRYTQYDFSSLKLYLDNSESIICEDIEKISRKKKYIVIENKDKNIVLQYDKVWKVEYYGLPKIIIKEDTGTVILQRIKKLLFRQKRK